MRKDRAYRVARYYEKKIKNMEDFEIAVITYLAVLILSIGLVYAILHHSA